MDRGVDEVDWPVELRVFKTADTTHYVAATVTAARVCATCRQPFDRSDRRSLTVVVMVPEPPSPSPAFQYRRFAAEVHHRACQLPELHVVRAAPDERPAGPFDGHSDMHYVLKLLPGPCDDPLPTLVFTTTDPIVVRDLERAEGRSAWVSTYLELGFGLFALDDLALIAATAPAIHTVRGHADGALFSLTGTLDGRTVPLLEWTRPVDHPAYQRWRTATTRSGRLFVVYGEYVHVDTVTGAVDLAPGGRLGDVTAAVVTVEGGLGSLRG